SLPSSPCSTLFPYPTLFRSLLLSFAFKRYFETSGLFGTPEVCLRMVERLKAIGVDEVACLIDFGVDFDSTMASLELLNEVRIRRDRKSTRLNSSHGSISYAV